MPLYFNGTIANFDISYLVKPVVVSDVTDYQFQLKGTSATVPTTTNGTSYTITNSSVSMTNDATRGYVFYWSDTTSRYLTLPTTASIAMTNGITRTWWINMSSSTSNANSNNLYSGDGWPIYPIVTTGTGYKVTSHPKFSTGASVVDTTNRNFATWYFFATTATTTTTKLYVNNNGTPIATATGTNSADTTDAIQFGVWKGSSGGFVGMMDDMRQYSRILSDAEILQIYNATKK